MFGFLGEYKCHKLTQWKLENVTGTVTMGKLVFDKCIFMQGFPGGTVWKNLPAVQETKEAWVWSLGQEDLLEKEMATHSSILAWEIPRTEEPGGL